MGTVGCIDSQLVIDMEDVDPIVWFCEWTKLNITDFQTKRNLKLNNIDFFLQEVHVLDYMSNYVFLIIMSLYMMIECTSDYTSNEAKLNENEKNQFI